MYKKEEDEKSAEMPALNAKLYQEEQEKAAALKKKKTDDSFYQKLVAGFDLREYFSIFSANSNRHCLMDDCMLQFI